MSSEAFTIFYLNPGATEEICAIVRSQMPEGWRFTQAGPGSDLGTALAECDFLLVPEYAVTADHIAAAPRLRLIQHQGVGYDRIDLRACRARRIPVALTPEGTSVGVAEHTLLLILATCKQLVVAAESVREGRWLQWELRDTSFELFDKTLGLVGLGRIGREVARRALAFGARVIYFDPLVPAAPPDLPVICSPRLDDLLGAADIVSLHVPLVPENRHLINRQTLACMKPGAVLINTARGGLVDEQALVAALQSGHLRAAALDVLEREPPDPANPLLRLPNVIVTPHISAGTRDALITKMRAAFANMARCARGEPLQNVVPELADLAGAPTSSRTSSRT